jgi:hypothetical protein
MDGSEAVAGDISFTDVPAGQWYTNAIKWASKAGAIEGVGNNLFGLGQGVTRQQIATMLYRYLKSIDAIEGIKPDDLSDFSDSDKIASWALEAMEWIVGAGIMEGYDSALHPGDTATRAQVATLFMRVMEYIDNYELVVEAGLAA